MKNENIYTRKYFYPLTADADCFEGKYKECPLNVARDVSSRILVLPLYPELEDDAINRITEVINVKG